MKLTRSESLQIEIARRKDDPAEKFILDILLAEQKRSEGCAFCNSDAFNRVGVSNEPWDKPRVYLCGGNGKTPESERFDYCPKCGKRLTEGESV